MTSSTSSSKSVVVDDRGRPCTRRPRRNDRTSAARGATNPDISGRILVSAGQRLARCRSSQRPELDCHRGTPPSRLGLSHDPHPRRGGRSTRPPSRSARREVERRRPASAVQTRSIASSSTASTCHTAPDRRCRSAAQRQGRLAATHNLQTITSRPSMPIWQRCLVRRGRRSVATFWVQIRIGLVDGRHVLRAHRSRISQSHHRGRPQAPTRCRRWTRPRPP